MHVAQFQVVLSFLRQDDLPERAKSIIDRLAKEMNLQQVTPIGLPKDAPPELPRVLLAGGGTVVQLSLNQLALVVVPPTHVTDSLESGLRYLENLCAASLKHLIELVPKPEWAGIVTTIKFPKKSAKTGIEAVTSTARSLVNINFAPEGFASFNLLYGFRQGALFYNVTVQGYETRSVTVNVKDQTEVDISPSNAPVTEAGVQLILDVNSRPTLLGVSAKDQIAILSRETDSFYRKALTFLPPNLDNK